MTDVARPRDPGALRPDALRHPTAEVPAGAPGGAAAGLSPRLLLGATVASIGGPLALVAGLAPAALADTGSRAPLVAALGVAAFAAPVFVWCRYTRVSAGPGGLYAFTRLGLGRRVALAQAALWTGSYLLYLLYTGDYVAHDVLPTAAPALRGWPQPVLELGLPAAVAAVALAPLRTAMRVVAGVAAGQVALVVAVVATAARASGLDTAPPPSASGATTAAAAVGLLFACASLPLFLGGEVRGGGTALRRTLVPAVVAVGVVVVAGAAFQPALRPYLSLDVPAAGLARDAGGAGYAAVVVAGVAASTLALVVVEYVALTRLVHAVTGVPVRTVSRLLVVLLTAAAAAAAIAPGRLSATLLRPSLVALWLALLVPVIGYPAFRRRFAALTLVDVAAAVVATALFGYGLLESFRAAST